MLDGARLHLHTLLLEAAAICSRRLEGQLPLVPGCGPVSTATPAAAHFHGGAGQRGFGAQSDALAVDLDLPPPLQDGGTGLVAGGLLQAAAQVSGRGLHNGGLQEATVWQAFGGRARRADNGFEVVQFFRNAVVAVGADGGLGPGEGQGQGGHRGAQRSSPGEPPLRAGSEGRG